MDSFQDLKLIILIFIYFPFATTDDDRLPLSASVILNNSEGNTKTNKQNDEPLSKSGKIKEHLLLQARHLESKVRSHFSLFK